MMIVSDIDGTILPSKGKISKRNKKAIKYFEENGGIFTLATGRSIAAAEYIAEEIGISVPIIVDNGALIYDRKTDLVLYKADIPSGSEDMLKEILNKFPECSAEVYHDREFFVINPNVHIINHVRNIEHAEPVVADMDKCPKPWQKVLTASDEDVAEKVYEFGLTLPHDGIKIVRSSKNYVELIPSNSTKGEGTLKLAEMLGIDRKNLITAGDYLNDIELIKAGGISFAPCDGHEEIKAAADFVVGRCEDGIIADITEQIEK